VLAACARYLQAHPAAGTVVCVCPDDGSHYATTIFDDGWMSGQPVKRPGAPGLPVTRIMAGAGGHAPVPAADPWRT
jgi:hypothetical protein